LLLKQLDLGDHRPLRRLRKGRATVIPEMNFVERLLAMELADLGSMLCDAANHL
jgi:hypothetical protein